MIEEQITIRAVVRALDGQKALVEVEHGGCGRCHEKGGCGGQQLTQMFCSGPKTYQVDNAVGAAVGDHVTVAVPPGRVSRSANLAYILPLTAAIGGAALGSPLGGDLGAMLGAVGGLTASFVYLRFHSRRDAGNSAGRPHIIANS